MLTDGLREKGVDAIARVLGNYGAPWGLGDRLIVAEAVIDTVLAVVDPDGLRAEVERLRRSHQHCLSDLIQFVGEPATKAIATRDEAQRLETESLHVAIAGFIDQRDIAARENAALRAGVEAAMAHLDPDRAPYAELRALLANPTPKTDQNNHEEN